MGVTAFSFLLPLCLIWVFQPTRLLQTLLIASIFEAAAALTVGGLGVQPGLVPAIAFLCYMALQFLLGARYPGQSQVWQIARPLVFVTVWALLSSYLMPRLFEGQVFVWPQKAAPPFVLTLLEPNPANLNQDFYLIINIAVFVVAAVFLTNARVALKSLMQIYFASVIVAAAIGVWQLGNRVAGIPYPESLFYSNPGWAILTEQSIGSVPRINGPFSEPSAFGSYMATAVCATGWLMLQGHRDRIVRALFVVGLLGVLLSTSTTGFGVLAIVAAATPVYALVTGATRLLKGIIRVGLPLLLIVALLGIGASTFTPDLLNNVGVVLDATMNKQSSSSYEDRTSTDIDSLNAVWDTYGLGVGWGSNRSSSLLPGLLAGVGIPGVAGLLWFGANLAGHVRKARKRGCSREHLLVIDGCCGALIGILLGALLSGPSIGSVTFYFLLSLLTACVVRTGLDEQARRAWRRGRDQAGAAIRPTVMARYHEAATSPLASDVRGFGPC